MTRPGQLLNGKVGGDFVEREVVVAQLQIIRCRPANEVPPMQTRV